jgi:hypothetical protein
MLDWLSIPIDATRGHDLAGSAAWHGRLMVLAWAALLPLGIIIARFWKITPGQDWPRRVDNKVWWHAHLALQYAGAACVGLAIILVLASGGMPRGLHAYLGWIIVGLLVMQILGGWLRGSKGGPTAPHRDGSLRGDHYDMTRRRLIFEGVHKSLGYAAISLAVACIATGLWAANAPRWMWLLLAAWFALLGAVAVTWQRQGRAIDTYQAIWGPDPMHPGNQRPAAGWGTRRPAIKDDHA